MPSCRGNTLPLKPSSSARSLQWRRRAVTALRLEVVAVEVREGRAARGGRPGRDVKLAVCRRVESVVHGAGVEGARAWRYGCVWRRYSLGVVHGSGSSLEVWGGAVEAHSSLAPRTH